LFPFSLYTLITYFHKKVNSYLINKFFDVNEVDFCGPFWDIFEVVFGRKIVPKLSVKPFNLSFCEGL
jgi:hypothetical protein